MNKQEILTKNNLTEAELELCLDNDIIQFDGQEYLMLSHIVRHDDGIDTTKVWKTIREWVFLVQAYKDVPQNHANSMIRNNTNFPHAIDIHGEHVWDYSSLLQSYINEAKGMIRFREFLSIANVSKYFVMGLEERGLLKIHRTSDRKWYVNFDTAITAVREHKLPEGYTAAGAAKYIGCTPQAIRAYDVSITNGIYPREMVHTLKHTLDKIKAKSICAKQCAIELGVSRQQISNLIDAKELIRLKHPLSNIVWVSKTSFDSYVKRRKPQIKIDFEIQKMVAE